MFDRRSLFGRSLMGKGLGERSGHSFHMPPGPGAGEEQTADAVQWSNTDDVLWSDGTTMEFS